MKKKKKKKKKQQQQQQQQQQMQLKVKPHDTGRWVGIWIEPSSLYSLHNSLGTQLITQE